MTRLHATAILLLALAASAAAGPPTTAKEAAWFAHRAGEAGDRAAIPDLLAMLERKIERGSAHGYALDALVRLDAGVPPPILARILEHGVGTVTLILVARQPKAHREALLRQFDRRVGHDLFDGHAVAIGNLLCEMRPPGFAGRLLRGIELRLDVLAVDWRGGIGIGMSGRSGSSCSVLRPRPGFPPPPLYQLVLGKEREGFKLLADGPRPVLYRRSDESSVPGIMVPRDEIALEWLAALARTTVASLDLPVQRSVTVRWKSDAHFLVEAGAQRTAVRQRWWQMVRALERRGALTAEEAMIARAPIQVSVRDHRRQSSGPLPTLPPDASEAAWTAYEVGAAGNPAAAKGLIELLYRRDGPNESLVRRAVLDALIRLDVKVHADHLLPDLDGETRDLALILIAREPRKNRNLLLSLFDAWMPDVAHDGRPTWIDGRLDHVASLLARERAQGFAGRLLTIAAPRLTLILVDRVGTAVPIGTVARTEAIRAGPDGPDGFPPYADYELRVGSESGYARREFRRSPAGPRARRQPLFPAMLPGWLTTLSGRPRDDVRSAICAFRAVAWRDETHLAAFARERRDEVLRAYWALVRSLVQQGILPVEEAQLEPRVEIRIEDRREKPGAVALPRLSPSTVEPNLPDD